MPIEPFKERVAELARARGMSVAQLRFEAYDADVKGTNPDTTAAILAGRRPLSTAAIEAFARVLEVPPSDFPEYRLLLLRDQLDPAPANLAAAVDLLERIEAATRTAAAAESRRAAEPRSPSAEPKRASGRGSKKARGG